MSHPRETVEAHSPGKVDAYGRGSARLREADVPAETVSVEEEAALQVVELRRRGLGCLLGALLIPVALLFGYSGLLFLFDPRLWFFGVMFLFVPLASFGYLFWTPKAYELGPDGVTIRYALGRSRKVAYQDLAEVRLRGKDTAFFRLRGRLLQGFRAGEYDGDFNAAVRRLLVAATEHDIPVNVDPRGMLGLGSKSQRARDLAAWEEQVGIRAQLPRAVARKKRS